MQHSSFVIDEFMAECAVSRRDLVGRGRSEEATCKVVAPSGLLQCLSACRLPPAEQLSWAIHYAISASQPADHGLNMCAKMHLASLKFHVLGIVSWQWESD